MKKRIISIIIMLLLTVTSLTAVTAADSGDYITEDGTVYKYVIRKIGDINHRETKLCIDEIVPGKNVTVLDVPAEIDGVPVYRVSPLVNHTGSDRFDGITAINLPEGIGDIELKTFKGLKEIDIPSSVTSLRDSAFAYCTALQRVTLPDNLTRIGNSTFENCTSLKSITIPESVSLIGNSAFKGCTSLKNVVWNKNADMGSNVFDETKYRNEGEDGLLLINNDTVLYTVLGKIKTVEIPETVTRVYQEAFKDSAVEKVICPASLKIIENNAFAEAHHLKEVEFKGKVTEMESCAFRDCESLTKAIIPDGVTEISWGCFLRCTGLEKVDIPAEITYIDSGAFGECSGLKAVTLHEGLEKIGPNAFYQCSALEEITIPSTVKTIYALAFENCKSLKKLDIKGAAEIGEAAFCGTALEEKNITLADGVVYVPVKKNKLYKNDPLRFMYDNADELTEEPVHTPRQPVEEEDSTKRKPRATEEPDVTVKPKETAKPEVTAKPEITIKPEVTAKPEASTKPILEVKNSGGELEVSANEKKINFTDALPFIDGNNRTQLPVRAVSESIGCKVEYDDNAKIVYITSTDEKIQLKIGSEDMIVNNEVIKMDTSAQIINDRTYIPIRYIAEALGYDVIWRE